MAAPWTDRDRHRLARMLERGVTFERIGEKLGRTASACSTRASADGMSGPDKATPRPWRWTPEEDAVIRGRDGASCAGVAALLPGRTLAAIQRRACTIRAVGNTRWTPEEDEAVRSRGTTTLREVADSLPGRTAKAVMQRAFVIGAQQRTRRASSQNPWTEDDDVGLDALLWSGATRGEIAAQLGRSESAVRQRAMGRAKRP